MCRTSRSRPLVMQQGATNDPSNPEDSAWWDGMQSEEDDVEWQRMQRSISDAQKRLDGWGRDHQSPWAYTGGASQAAILEPANAAAAVVLTTTLSATTVARPAHSSTLLLYAFSSIIQS